MQYKAFEPNIELRGVSVGALLDVFRLFPSIALRRLANHGIGTNRDETDVARDTWYRLDAWLDVLEDIANTAGENALYQVGQHVPKYTLFPEEATDIASALGALDIAHHMNHRRNGEPMFDATTRRMTEGIGHYRIASEGARAMTCVCETPYPCRFDHGLLAALAARFHASAQVTHEDSRACRRQGADTCTYLITW